MHHHVPGKGKKKKKQSIVKTLLQDENLDFEMFVKVSCLKIITFYFERIQQKCPWMPKCVPKRDLRTIDFAANQIGWHKLLNKKFVVHESPLFEKFRGALSKFEPWRKELILNKQFEKSK